MIQQFGYTHYFDWAACQTEKDPQNLVKRLQKEFPELTHVTGHVFTKKFELKDHCWCLTKTGHIIDVLDLMDKVVFYIPQDEKFMPLGICPACNSVVFDSSKKKYVKHKGKYFCNEHCFSEIQK